MHPRAMVLKLEYTLESPKPLVINADLEAPASEIWTWEIWNESQEFTFCKFFFFFFFFYKILILSQATMLRRIKKRRKVSIKTNMVLYRVIYYSSMDRGAWKATVLGVAELSD